MSGYQHSCLYDGTPRCPRNRAGKPVTKKCPACRGPWLVQQGVFGVFTWRSDGRYNLENAHASYASALRADKHAVTDVNFVVRFITA